MISDEEAASMRQHIPRRTSYTVLSMQRDTPYGFSSGSCSRFPQIKNDNPGPGAYNPELPSKSIYNVPRLTPEFLSGNRRKLWSKGESPGPSFYRPKYYVDRSIKHKLPPKDSSRRGERDAIFSTNSIRNNVPGPGSYDIDPKLSDLSYVRSGYVGKKQNYKDTRSYVFKSKCVRDTYLPKDPVYPILRGRNIYIEP